MQLPVDPGSDEAVRKCGRLVTEFESSDLGQGEFCRKEGLPVSTLRRQLSNSGRIESSRSHRPRNTA
jgi:hypothetical protein